MDPKTHAETLADIMNACVKLDSFSSLELTAMKVLLAELGYQNPKWNMWDLHFFNDEHHSLTQEEKLPENFSKEQHLLELGAASDIWPASILALAENSKTFFLAETNEKSLKQGLKLFLHGLESNQGILTHLASFCWLFLRVNLIHKAITSSDLFFSTIISLLGPNETFNECLGTIDALLEHVTERQGEFIEQEFVSRVELRNLKRDHEHVAEYFTKLALKLRAEFAERLAMCHGVSNCVTKVQLSTDEKLGLDYSQVFDYLRGDIYFEVDKMQSVEVLEQQLVDISSKLELFIGKILELSVQETEANDPRGRVVFHLEFTPNLTPSPESIICEVQVVFFPKGMYIEHVKCLQVFFDVFYRPKENNSKDVHEFSKHLMKDWIYPIMEDSQKQVALDWMQIESS
eukprot:TRINITY_DN27555_c0_g1_i1.p1 TRINITY_DN27555_c0_g1~~TRINITY_DN27555_c0_g1_i1.p1  ORF type:complete len:403 (+),score=102.39 TRINITY_DN27555_c0_g1_i1:2028-3236(+)